MATLTLPNGTTLTQVTRASCLARLAAIPLASIPYSHEITPVTGRRADCTGLVCEVWATPEAGPGIWGKAYTTGSFYTEKVIERIGWAHLRPGDAVGYFAANSPGNGGHGAIWMGDDPQTAGRFHVVDHGSGWGPKDRWVKWDGVSTGWLHPDHLGAWRYVGIIEDGDDMTPADLLRTVLGSTGPTVGVALQSTYQRLSAIERTLSAIAAKVDIDATELAALEAAARAGAQAGVVASVDELVTQIVARLPDRTLTKAEVEQAVRDAFAGGLAPDTMG